MVYTAAHYSITRLVRAQHSAAACLLTARPALLPLSPADNILFSSNFFSAHNASEALLPTANGGRRSAADTGQCRLHLRCPAASGLCGSHSHKVWVCT